MAAESVKTLYREWRTKRIAYERLLGQFAQHLSTAEYVIPLQSQQLESQACQIGELELMVKRLTNRLMIVQGEEVDA